MAADNSVLKGVKIYHKSKQRIDALLHEPITGIKKNKNFKKPCCPREVLLHLALSDSKEKSAMDVWSVIREMFPYYVKRSNFTLSSITQILRSSVDVNISTVCSDQKLTRKEKFGLKPQVKFSYSLEDIIGQGEDLTQYTKYPELILKCLKRSHFSPRPVEQINVTKECQTNVQKYTKLLSEFHSHTRLNHETDKLRENKNSMNSQTHMAKIISVNENGNNIEPDLKVNCNDTRGICPTFKDSFSQGNIHAECQAQVFKEKPYFYASNTSHENLSELITPIDNSKLPNDKDSHKRYSKIPVTKVVSEEKEKWFEINFEGDKSYRRKKHDNNKSKNNPKNSNKKSKSKVKLKRNSTLKNELSSMNLSYDIIFPIEKNDFDPLNLNNNEILVSTSDIFSTTDFQSEFLVNNIYSRVPETFSKEDTVVNGSQPETQEILFLEEVLPSPDSTFDDGCENDSLSHPQKKRKLKIKERGEVSVNPESESIVSSTSSRENGSECNYFEPIKDVQKHILSPSTSNIFTVATIVGTELLSNMKLKFNWLLFDSSLKCICCEFCNGSVVVSSSLKFSDLEIVLRQHNSSKEHILSTLKRIPKAFEVIYFLLKTNLDSVTSRIELRNEFSNILTKLREPELDEECISKLLNTYKEYTEFKVLSYLKRSKLPYTLVLSFCHTFAIIRTCNELGELVESVLLWDNLSDRTVIGFLNFFKLSANQLMYFSVLPNCQNCSDCGHGRNIVVDNSYVSFPHRLPSLNDLLRLVCKDPVIVPYQVFITGILSLYLKYPIKFRSIKGISILRNANIWELFEFIAQNMTALKNVCREIFRKHGEVIALALSKHDLLIDDKLLATLRCICSVIKFIRDNIIVMLNDTLSITKIEIYNKLKNLESNLFYQDIHSNIKNHVKDFLNELSVEVYYHDWGNARTLQSFCDPSFFRNLGDKLSDSTKASYKIFSMMEKYMNSRLSSITEELRTFAVYVSNYCSTIHCYSLSYYITVFTSEPSLKNKFPLAYKFYCLMRLLPLYSGKKDSYSSYFVHKTYKNLSEKFGHEFSKSFLTIYFDDFPRNSLDSLRKYFERKFIESTNNK